jgi:HEPN domain-containing protein
VSSTSAPDPESAIAWFRLALGDLRAARALVVDTSVPLRLAAALAQQAAEKALKSAIALAGSDPPRTHDLIGLWAQASSNGLLHADPIDLAALSDGLRSGRYPDPEEPSLSRPEADELIVTAQLVIDAVQAHLAARDVAIEAVEPA